MGFYDLIVKLGGHWRLFGGLYCGEGDRGRVGERGSGVARGRGALAGAKVMTLLTYIYYVL